MGVLEFVFEKSDSGCQVRNGSGRKKQERVGSVGRWRRGWVREMREGGRFEICLGG